MGGTTNGATILVLSHLRYDFVYQRPQQVVSRLARDHQVLFVEEPVRTDGPPRLRTWQPDCNVQVLQPQTPLAAQGFHDDQVPMLRELLQAQFSALKRPVIWLYTPMALPLIAELEAGAIVYDCMDELSAFRFAPRQLQQREAALLKRADIVFTGGRSLYRAKHSRHQNVQCFPSAVDAALFADDPAWRDPWPQVERPRLGYYGVIDERIDLPLLDRLARDRPHWQIFMIGPVAKIDPGTLPRRTNIHWLGQQAFASLPRMVAYWDVCLLPFALNEATRYISPTKTLEYMAAGKPIVSTPVRDVADCYGQLVRIADSAGTFVRACDAALAEGEGERKARSQLMRDLAADQSWDATVAGMLRALHGKREHASCTGYENIVIGAGPTGLAAALGLSRDTLVLEREERIGGSCRSIVRDGCTFDYAGHVMSSTEPGVLALYERLLGANVHWQHGTAAVYRDGTYDPYPFEPALHALPGDFLENPRTDPGSVTDTRFGYPLRGGFQALMDGFLPLLPGELRTGAEVVAIDGPARRVTLAAGATFAYQNLLATAPLPQVVQMLGESAPSGVRAAASALRAISLRCVNIVVRRANITDRHCLYYPDGAIFHRVLAQTNVNPAASSPGTFGLTCEIAYTGANPLPCEGEALVARVLADCRRVGLLRAEDNVELAFEVDIPLAYVMHDEHCRSNVERIRNWLLTMDIHLAGRYAEWDHRNADHAFLSGRCAAQKLTHRLPEAGKFSAASTAG